MQLSYRFTVPYKTIPIEYYNSSRLGENTDDYVCLDGNLVKGGWLATTYLNIFERCDESQFRICATSDVNETPNVTGLTKHQTLLRQAYVEYELRLILGTARDAICLIWGTAKCYVSNICSICIVW